MSIDAPGETEAAETVGRNRYGRILVTLAIGAGGGTTFSYLGLPLPWITGSICFAALAALMGAPVADSWPLRAVMIAVLGLMIGSNFTPETLSQAGRWIPSIILLLLFTLASTILLGIGLRRFFRFGAVDAYCAATPGGFSEMVILGGSLGGSERTISLVHTIRVAIIVLAVPAWYQVAYGYAPSGSLELGAVAGLAPIDATILFLCAVVGYFAARFLRFPVPILSGPMFLSAGVHLGGLTQAGPTPDLIAIAQIVVGVGIGCRFRGITLAETIHILRAALIMTALMLAGAVLFAGLAQPLTGLPFEALLLAFSPGGVAEMNLITVALGIEPAMVATHHLVRLGFLILCAPFFVKWLSTRSADGTPRT
ncbi:MAG: AbrB family transcriptional regulator [Rhodospirillales bacterium]|nr:AbrB family transcriptional regulator [Rhodospirillales bacterium]